jgi:hypothetical protein
MGGDSPKNYESFDREAAKQRAELTREQWDDYKTRFSPWEEKLIAFNQDENVSGLAQTRARGGVGMAFNSGRGQYARNQSRLGLGTTLDASESRTLALGKASATAQAVNDARTYTTDRKEKIMTSGLGAAAGQVRV